jgi:hypothetical protein
LFDFLAFKEVYVMIHRVTHLARVGLVALLLAAGLAWAFSRTPQGVQALCVNPLHISGVNIVKCDGTIIHLRGANQASAYNFQSDWTNTSKSDPNAAGNPLNPTTLSVMANTWLMNAIRIPVSAYIYNETNQTICGGSARRSTYLAWTPRSRMRRMTSFTSSSPCLTMVRQTTRRPTAR